MVTACKAFETTLCNVSRVLRILLAEMQGRSHLTVKCFKSQYTKTSGTTGKLTRKLEQFHSKTVGREEKLVGDFNALIKDQGVAIAAFESLVQNEREVLNTKLLDLEDPEVTLAKFRKLID